MFRSSLFPLVLIMNASNKYMVKRDVMEDLLLRYYEGGTSEEETVLVEEWLKSSEENQRIAKQVQLLDLAADMAQLSSWLDVDKALENTHKKMERRQVIGRYRRFFRGIQQAAAILFIPLLLSWTLLYFGKEPVEQMMEVKTNPGMTASVVLPDSTVVILNSSSSLKYPSSFTGDKREVKLLGEAFFSVTKDAKRKFVVNALNGSQIEVYGTEFNVETYKENKMVQTTLVSGKVGFSYKENGKREFVMMKPGQKIAYDVEQEKAVLKKANVDVETSWKDGRLVFKNTPFEEILRMLTKRYNVKFIVKNDALKQNSFTGIFVRQRLERVLEQFRISSNIRFRFIENSDMSEERQTIEVY